MGKEATIALPEGFTIDEPSIAPPEGFEVVSGETLTSEDIMQSNVLRAEQSYVERSKQTRAALDSPYPLSATKDFTPAHQLESLLDMGPFRDKQVRDVTIARLNAQGIPKHAIADYMALMGGDQGIMGVAKKEALPAVGEIAGGVIGGKLGGWKSAVGASGVGRGVGSAIYEGLLAHYRPELERSWDMAANEVTYDILEGLASEGASQGIIKGYKSVGFKGTKIPDAQRLSDMLTDAGKRAKQSDMVLSQGPLPNVDATLLISQKVADTKAGLLDNVAAKSITGSERIRKTKLGKNPAAWKVHTRETLAGFADDLSKYLSPTEMAVELNRVIEGTSGAKEAFRGVYRKPFEQLDELAKGLKISNAPVVKIGREITEQVSAGKLLKGSDEGAAFIKDVSGLSGESSFQQAIKNRSTLLAWGRRFDVLDDRNSARIVRKMADALDTSMAEAAKKQGKGAYGLYRQGADAFKEFHETFDHDVIMALAKKVKDHPELAVKSIFQDEAVTQIGQVKKILLGTTGKKPAQIKEGKQVWEQLKTSYLDYLMRGSASQDGFVVGEFFEKKLRTMGKEGIDLIFSPRQKAIIKDYSELGRLWQGAIQGEGGMLIQLMTPTAAFGVIKGKGAARIGAAFVLSLPPVWARMTTSPKYSRIMTEGLKDMTKQLESTGTITKTTKAMAKMTNAYFDVRKEYLTEEAQRMVRQKDEDVMRKYVMPMAEGLKDFGPGL